jgi:hypothetical protein
VLGQYAEACPQSFMPFVEPALKTLTTMVEYWHDEARAAAYDSLQKLVLATHACFPPAQHTAAASNGNAGSGGLSPQVAHVLGVALPLLTSPMEYDTSKVAVAAAAGGVVRMCRQQRGSGV